MELVLGEVQSNAKGGKYLPIKGRLQQPHVSLRAVGRRGVGAFGFRRGG